MQWTDVLATRNARMKASEIRELLKLLDQPDIISFAGGIPDPNLFPAEAFSRAFEDAMKPGLAGIALQYSVSEGYKPLREWLVGEMAKIGIPCDADNIFITSGSAQWSLMAPIFIPMLMMLGYEPALVQAAFRIADSSTNIISPMSPYFAVCLAFLQKYQKDAGIGTLASMTIPVTRPRW